MPKILVTGGCGFIGSNFIRLVLETEPEISIINFDALTYAGNLANLKEYVNHPRYQFIQGDITDSQIVAQTLAATQQSEIVDTIFNFAAESHVDRSILDSRPFVNTNVLGTQTLLDAARKFGIRRFVQVSTDEVYGSLGPTGLFSETTPLSPNSPYSASKASADLLVQSYVHTFGLDAVITRCSNNYGPYQFPEKLIPLFIHNLMRDRQVPVYGDGMQIRDWIHVLDHCRGILAAWEKGHKGEVYNFGGRCEKANIEITRLLLKLLGKPESLIQYVQDRPGHDRRYAIDCSKAERVLGWVPEMNFDQGLQQTIDWYRSNQAWVEAITSGEYRHYYQKQYGQRLGSDSK